MFDSGFNAVVVYFVHKIFYMGSEIKVLKCAGKCLVLFPPMVSGGQAGAQSVGRVSDRKNLVEVVSRKR